MSGKSCASWWGDSLPVNWSVAPLYSKYDVQLGKMLNPEASSGPHQAPYVGNADVRWGSVSVDDPKTMSFDANDRARFRLRHGDVLVCEGGEVGRTAVWRSELPECYYQKAVHRLRPRDAGQSPQFLYYLMSAATAAGAFAAGGNKTTFVHLTAEKLRAHRFPFPTPRTQNLIATDLDRKTTAIDAVIAKKARLIELLQEKRQALITQAVTKGLDPGVPMKESGLPSVGTMPGTWIRTKVRRVCISLRDGTHAPPPREEGAYRLLSARNIKNGRLVLLDDDRTMGEAAFRVLDRSYTVRPGDVVMTIVGATTGKCGIVYSDILNSSAQRSIAILRPRASLVTAEYLHMWMSGDPFQACIQETIGKYAAQPGIYLDECAALPVLLPPLEEQQRILDHLAPKFDALAAVGTGIQKHVGLLREYRQSLITAAVTGKLDISAEE